MSTSPVALHEEATKEAMVCAYLLAIGHVEGARKRAAKYQALIQQVDVALGIAGLALADSAETPEAVASPTPASGYGKGSVVAPMITEPDSPNSFRP